MDPAFRFVHASDLHFSDRPRRVSMVDAVMTSVGGQALPGSLVPTRFPYDASSQDDNVAEKFAQFVEANVDGIDAVILSGDLATTGSQADLATARAFLDGFSGAPRRAHLNVRRSDNSYVDRLAIPGNHDRYGLPFFLPAAVHEFQTAFRGSSSTVLTLRAALRLARYESQGVSVALVGADFSLRSSLFAQHLPFGFLGEGFVEDQVLRDLVATTRNVVPAATWTIWVVHFPPRQSYPSPPGITPQLSLRDDHNLVAAAHANASVVLTGHTHSQCTYAPRAPSAPYVLCSGTTTQYAVRFETGNHFNLIEIRETSSGGWNLVVTPYTFDRRHRALRFEAGPPSSFPL